MADCLPVLLADRSAGVIAAAHAGRVGLLGGVLARTVEAMQQAGARELQAWIGPHISRGVTRCPSRWLPRQPKSSGDPCDDQLGTPAIDLAAGATAQLTGLRVTVTRCDPCTLTAPELFSHRGDGPTPDGRSG